jgi:uncharacterized membrane protein
MLSSLVGPIGLALWVAAIILVEKSPKKLRTLGLMTGVFVATATVFFRLGPTLRLSDAKTSGIIGVLMGLLVALIVGSRHIRALKRSPAKTAEEPISESLVEGNADVQTAE